MTSRPKRKACGEDYDIDNENYERNSDSEGEYNEYEHGSEDNVEAEEESENSSDDDDQGMEEEEEQIEEEGDEERDEDIGDEECDEDIGDEERDEGIDGKEYEDDANDNAFPTTSTMTALQLREKLTGPDGPVALKTYFSQQNNYDIASEYIKEGGSIEELLSQLSLVDLRKGVAVDVFSAMTMVILKSMKEYPERQSEIAEDCKQFITTYIHHLTPMLTQKKSLNRKKVVLKLLTAIASVNDTLALQIIAGLNLKNETLHYLAEHNNPLDENCIRISYIKFLLSLIVGHHSTVINRLCEKRYWIPVIFSGMTYDLFQTVDVILTALEEWIISRKDITKNSKLYAFNSKSLSQLANLYEWNPKIWKEKVKDKKIVIPNTDPWELSQVRAKVHRLLLHLCTSFKTGVIFNDPKYGTSQQNANNLVQQFIVSLSLPWDDELKSELLHKILIVCPDLIKPYCNVISSILNLPPSPKWFKANKFITKVIEEVEVMPSFLTYKTWLKIIYNVFAPETLMEIITPERLITGDRELRFACLNLFATLINKLKLISSLISKPSLKNAFITNMVQYLIKISPNVEVLLGCLKISFNENNQDCINMLLQIIFTLYSLFPQLFDIVKYNKECIQMVHDKRETYKQLESSGENCLLILKLIKLEMLLNPIAEMKESSMKHLEDIFKLAYEKSDECKHLASELLKEIWNNTGLFMNLQFELALWIHLLSNHLTPDIGLLLVNALKYASKHKYEICNAIIWAQESDAVHIKGGNLSLDDFINLSVNEENGQFNDIKVDDVNTYNSNLDLSPLLPALLKTVSEGTNKKQGYSLLVSFMVHYLHTQVSTSAYKSLLSKYSCYAVDKFQSYLTSWVVKPKSLTLSPFADSTYEHISKFILLKSDEISLDVIDLNDKLLVELCLNQCIFTICQLSLIGQVLEENLNRVNNVIKHLISATTKLPLTHPQLISDFHPIRILENSNLTLLVISIIENSSLNIPESLIYPYSNRLFFELKYAKKNKSKLDHVANIKQLFLHFPMSKDHVEQLINVTFQMKPKYFHLNGELTPWVKVLEYLLLQASEFDLIIQDETLIQFCEIFNCLNKDAFNLSELSVALHKYLLKLNIEISGNLHDSFKELFTSVCTGSSWYDELGVYLMETLEEGSSLLPVDIPLERAIRLIASSNVKKKTDEHIVTEGYREILIALMSGPSPSWLTYLAQIVNSTMPKKICDKCCKDCNKLWDQIEISKGTLSVMKEIFTKSEQNDLFLNLLNKWLTENSQKSNHAKSEEICNTFLQVAHTVENINDAQKLDIDITKYLILHGMKRPSALMLDYLAYNVKINNVATSFEFVLEHIWSHTNFISLFVETSLVKNSLLKLIKELFLMDRSLIKESYLPLFLSAYNASLSECDQILLEVLQLFESSGVNMNVCKPYVWGEAAVEYYAIKKNAKVKKEQPFMTLENLNKDIVKNTIKNYPINRKLKGICSVEFQDVYDPAFLLPVINNTLISNDDDVKMNPWQVFQSGAVAIALASLGSNCSEVRAYGCLIIQKLHANKSNLKKDAIIWFHFIEATRRGLGEFNDKKKLPKLSSIVSTFLARASLIIADPTHYLYKNIQNFIHARLSINLKTIPALLEIFHSTGQNCRLHQQWILEVINDGIREPADLQLALNCFAFKFILDFHSCCLSNKEIKLLIEELICKCLRYADKERHFLINNYSLIPWLESSGKSTIILNCLPQKLVSQYKCLVMYVKRENKIQEGDDV